MESKEIQDLTNNFPVLFQCSSEDKDIIQVDHYNAFCDQLLEDAIHHCLEGGWSIGQPKEHDQGFIEATICPEGCYPLVSFFHANIIEPPADVEFSEILSTLKFVNEFRDEGKGVLVFHCVAFNAW